MAKVWFDSTAATNGSGASPKDPKNTISGYTFVAGNEHYFRRGSTFTGGFTMVSGTPNAKTKYKAWYNADGSDDLSKPKPLFNISAVISTYNGNNKDNCEVDSLRIVGNSLPVANDSYAIYIGHNSAIWNCDIDTNLGCIGAAGKSNVSIMYNTCAGVSHSSANNNSLIFASDSKDVDNIVVLGNILTFKGGGGASSSAIRMGTDAASFSMTNLLIADNIITPPVGVTYTTNQNAQGIRMSRCPNAEVRHNNVKGMVAGLFMTGGGAKWGCWVHHNTFCDNLNFGIHATVDITDCLIEYNDCSRNGTNIENATMHAYGRGIELSGSAGQSRSGYCVIRFNVLNGNLNYGGPLDNGSEGVGLGFDDGTVGNVAYGNIIMDNDGNGCQFYGGPLGAGWTDTSNHFVANFLKNNGKAAFKNRRTGGTQKTTFSAHIGMSAVIGGQSVVANNVIVDGDAGITQTSNCVNVIMANNIFVNVANAMAFGQAAGYGAFSNVFYSNGVTVKKYATTAVDGNGVPTWPTLAYTGTNDLVINPQLDANYRPLAGSPCIGTGHVISAYFHDATGKKFKSTPSIGMFENYDGTALPAIRH